jgi:hypothetical protein
VSKAKQSKTVRNLSKFPLEVLTLVSTHVDSEDLLAIRCTCWSFHNAAAKSFGQAFFAERIHVVSYHSLSNLIRISAHKTFGPLIHTLGFNSVFLPTPKSQPGHSSNIESNGWMPAGGANNEQLQFLTSGHFGHQLSRVLQNLKACGSRPIKMSIDCSEPALYGWGWRCLDIDDDMVIPDESSLPSPLDTYVKEVTTAYRHAIHTTCYPISGIVFEFPPVASGPTEVLRYLTPQTNAGVRVEGSTSQVPGGDLLVRFFDCTTQESCGSIHYMPRQKLLEYKVEFVVDVDGDFVTLTGFLPENSLSKLIVKSTTTIWQHGLERLLRRNRKLKHLELDSCCFSDMEWSEVFDRLNGEQEDFALEYCRFSNLEYTRPEIYIHGRDLEAACGEVQELKGHDRIVAGLEMLSERFELLEELIDQAED